MDMSEMLNMCFCDSEDVDACLHTAEVTGRQKKVIGSWLDQVPWSFLTLDRQVTGHCRWSLCWCCGCELDELIVSVVQTEISGKT